METKRVSAGEAGVLPTELCKGGTRCEALGLLEEGVGLKEEAEALLACKSFLWDVLLEGEWSGCSRSLVRTLAKKHGPLAVKKIFDEI